MMVHQDGSRHEWLAGVPPLDLIVTMDDATSEIYSAFLVEEEGTASTFRALKQVFTDKGLPGSLYTDRGSHYFHTPEAGGKVDKSNPTQVGRALHQLGVEHIAAYSPQARGRSERAFRNPPEPPGQGTQPRRHHRDRGRKPLHRRHISARSQPALRNKARTRSQRLRVTASARSGPRGPVPAHKARGRARQYRAPRKTGPANPRQPGQTPLRQGHGPGARVSRRHTRPLPRTPMPRPLSGRRRAHRHIKPAGRVSRFDATRRCPVDKWTAAPRLTTSPQGQPQQQKRTINVLQKPAKYTC